LIDMGVKPFLVASSIQAVMAQRLVRRICEECREPYQDVDPVILRGLGFSEQDRKNTTFYRGRGCSACSGTGYRGRMGIFELMAMDSTIVELAFRRAPVVEIRRAAIAAGMRPLVEDGRIKIATGRTTPDELFRIIQTTEFQA
jgi:type II secretory ATPase GspE/PulE/Tfp pilus assembly ATPase PilB-like protein